MHHARLVVGRRSSPGRSARQGGGCSARGSGRCHICAGRRARGERRVLPARGLSAGSTARAHGPAARGNPERDGDGRARGRRTRELDGVRRGRVRGRHADERRRLDRPGRTGRRRFRHPSHQGPARGGSRRAPDATPEAHELVSEHAGTAPAGTPAATQRSDTSGPRSSSRPNVASSSPATNRSSRFATATSRHSRRSCAGITRRTASSEPARSSARPSRAECSPTSRG